MKRAKKQVDYQAKSHHFSGKMGGLRQTVGGFNSLANFLAKRNMPVVIFFISGVSD